MTYCAMIYICASYIGSIDCESWELRKNPFALYFYDKRGYTVGHVEPMFNLIARVEIYKRSDLSKRKEGYVLANKYAFRNKGNFVLEENYKVNCEVHEVLPIGG